MDFIVLSYLEIVRSIFIFFESSSSIEFSGAVLLPSSKVETIFHLNPQSDALNNLDQLLIFCLLRHFVLYLSSINYFLI